MVVGPAVHHLAERLGAHAHGRGHGHHFAGHCLGRTELDGGHGDEIREATGDHRAAGEYDQHHEFGPCVDRQQEHNTLWDHGQRKRRHQPRQPAHRELGGEQAGDECARHAGNTDQAVGDAVDSGVEAEHCTNRVREADAGIADKHKVERRREQQQSEHVRPVLDEESHACLEVFKWGGQLLVAAIRGAEADEAFERGCAGEACDGDDHHETDAEHRIQHAAEEARQQTA